MPCSLATRRRQSPMPVYFFTLPLSTSGLESCVWSSSFTRSTGAITVLETAPIEPDNPRGHDTKQGRKMQLSLWTP